MPIPGFATEEGTQSFAGRFSGKLPETHFRKQNGLCFSSVGLGTYLGEPDETTDRLYEEAVLQVMSLGCNLIDTAINYRCQRSERSIGRALQRAVTEGRIRRSEIIVATKGGFIPFDDGTPGNPGRYFEETYGAQGLLQPGDIVAGCHAMTPRFIGNQIQRSLSNLNLECLDIYYLHNPETQLQEVPRPEFEERLKKVFEALERFVAEGKIRMYGTATWNGYRTSAAAKDYLSLEELLILAREAAGPGHHLKVIQLPFNLAMPEAFIVQNQKVGGGSLSLLEAASKLGVTVVASASLMQNQLAHGVPKRFTELFKGVETQAQCAIQFVRSTPGITTALVGMKNRAHIEENLRVAGVPPLRQEEYLELFKGVQG